MVHTSAPGKMMLAGEWAVLEVGNPCIVAAVNKRVHAEVSPCEKIIADVDDFSIKNVEADFDGSHIEWKNATDEQKEKLIFLKGAIEATLQYLGDYKPFHIRGWGEETSVFVDGIQKKLGFGSSAAAVVAAVAAILNFHDVDISTKESKDIIYKLSAIAHYVAQGKVGSAFDIAASTYGGITVYKRFDPKWLFSELETKTIKEVAEQNWPYFSAENLTIPEDFILDIAWTKESALTVNMVKEMNSFSTSNPDEYKRIYDEIAENVKNIINSWNSKEEIILLLNKNEILLRELTEKSGVPIEIPSLRLMSEIAQKYGAGKLSGAGGGDCGIAITFNKNDSEKIREEWKQNDLHPLDVSISIEGVKKH